MPSSHSVSEWVRDARRGDRGAAGRLWERYYRRLVQFARRRAPAPSLLCDEDDLASQTLQSFLARVEQGGFLSLENRQELWRLLTTIALRKAANTRRHAQRFKRRTDREGLASDAGQLPGPSQADSPEEAACLRERYARLIFGLDQELRTIVEQRIHGYTYVEIAARIQRSVPTVERRMRLLREKCRAEGISCRFD